jgi:VanZ family protein
MRMRLPRLDLWLPPLLLMGVIFFFSAQPSLDSGLGVIDSVGRKIVHFAEYALLCFLWWRALATVMSPGRAALLAFLLASGYAATDEYHQSFIDGRHGSALDWAIDTAGAATAAALGLRRARGRVRVAA